MKNKFITLGFWALTNWLVMVVLFLILTVLETFMGGFWSITSNISSSDILIYALVFWFGGSFISLLLSKWMAKIAYGIELVTEQKTGDEKLDRAIAAIYKISAEANIKVPEIGVYKSEDINAFATGATKNSALVAFSSELLKEMTPDEVEGVTAHEMAHILNGDMIRMTLVQGVMNVFVYLLTRIVSIAIATVVGKDWESVAYFVSSFILMFVFGFLSNFVVMYVSRRREYDADYLAAQLIGRRKMVKALERLQRIIDLKAAKNAMSPLMIHNQSDSIFSTHPLIENRISALYHKDLID